LIYMKMPRMNGVELIRAVRADSGLKDIKLAMLTSMSAAGEVAATRAAGADVYLTKPVRREELFSVLARLAGATTVDVPAIIAHQTEVLDCHGAQVLLAEDHPVNQEIARAMLEDTGCVVTIAANGRKAVEETLRQRFALVLMDCQMPELDGFEATRQIRLRESAGSARVPIVALTANAMTGDRERCLTAGMDDYLSKPFKRSDVTAVLRRWLDLAPQPLNPKVPQAAQVAQDLNSSASLPAPAAVTDDHFSVAGALAAFDPAAFQRVLPAGIGMGSALAHKVMKLFVGEAEKALTAIEHAFVVADAQALGRVAHALKSSAASVGAGALSEIAKELEALAREGTAALVTDHPARLRLAYECFCEEPAIRIMLLPESTERHAA
jgi:CheY-like chemotaxis protein/HPt (histidine-containing phosphotransfer) domain-containing protein